MDKIQRSIQTDSNALTYMIIYTISYMFDPQAFSAAAWSLVKSYGLPFELSRSAASCQFGMPSVVSNE